MCMGLLMNPTFAQHEAEETTHHETTHEEEKFNAGKFVIDHVSDAYDWHILSYKEHHVSIPLPIIVYKQD